MAITELPSANELIEQADWTAWHALMPMRMEYGWGSTEADYQRDLAAWKQNEPKTPILELNELADDPTISALVRKMEDVENAKRIIAAKRAENVPIPDGVSLADFLNETDETEDFVVEDVLPTNSNALLTAQAKSGKTTTVLNLIRSLVDGGPFLEYFEVVNNRTVGLLDFELSPNLLKKWFRAQNIQNVDAVKKWSLRGKAASFDITNDRVRSEWADRLAGCDVVILDPVRPVMDAIGLSEDHDAGVFLQAFDALKEEAGIGEGIIVQHQGHLGERARGDSRWTDWPDVIWRLNRTDREDPRALRYFDAFGRDVDVSRGVMQMAGDHRLVFNPDAVQGRADETVAGLVKAMEGKGELSTTEVINLGVRGVSKNSAPTVLRGAVEAGELLMSEGERGAKFYSVNPIRPTKPF